MKIVVSLICSCAALYTYSQNQTDTKNTVNDSAWQKILAKRDQRFIGMPYNTFSFTTKDGVVFSNASLKGKVVFINFWFEACPPCVAEFDALNALYLKYKNDPKFIFVSFSSDSLETVNSVQQKYHIAFPVISISKEECYRLNQQNGFPTSIILNTAGKIQFLHTGGSLEKEEIKLYFNTTLYPAIQEAL
ncbi:MAG: TlpA disulfide reductase family protein, partial [Ferruginibacter sp.]